VAGRLLPRASWSYAMRTRVLRARFRLRTGRVVASRRCR
jgi:hypothetical protein